MVHVEARVITLDLITIQKYVAVREERNWPITATERNVPLESVDALNKNFGLSICVYIYKYMCSLWVWLGVNYPFGSHLEVSTARDTPIIRETVYDQVSIRSLVLLLCRFSYTLHACEVNFVIQGIFVFLHKSPNLHGCATKNHVIKESWPGNPLKKVPPLLVQ